MMGQYKIGILKNFYQKALEINKENPGLVPQPIIDLLMIKLRNMQVYVKCNECKHSGNDEYGKWVCFEHQEHLAFNKRICEDWEKKPQ